MRADMIRYLILYEFGGVYVDLDFESLKPLDILFAAHGHAEYHSAIRDTKSRKDSAANATVYTGSSRFSAIIGQEPDAHAHILYKLPSMVCNAMMVSCPGHPFWLEVVELIKARFASGVFKKRVLKLTGPMVVQAALDNRRKFPELSTQSPVMLADPDLFYPSFDTTNENLRHNCNEELLAKACALGHRTMDSDAESLAANAKKKSSKALSPQQCARRKKTCKKLRRAHFQNNKAFPGSFANHHWTHSWLPGFEDRYRVYTHGSSSCTFMNMDIIVGPDADYEKARRKCSYYDGMPMSRSRSRRYANENYASNNFAWTGRAKLPDFCLTDKKRLCANVKPGEGRTHECMCENVKDIADAECQSFVQNRIAKKKMMKREKAESTAQ
eukprot:g1902.t1